MGIFLRCAVAGLLAACMLCTAMPAWSDQAEGTAAYRQGDYARALAIWEPLAERGERGSQFCLGVLYHLGRGVEKDLAEAHKWYSLAAKRGHPHAGEQVQSLQKQMTHSQLEDARRRLAEWATQFEPNLIDGAAPPDRGGIGLVLRELSRKKVRGVTEVCYAASATGLSPDKTYRLTMWPLAHLAEGKPEAIVLDDIKPLPSGRFESAVNLCFDRLLQGDWSNVTVSSRDGTQVAGAKAYPFPLEARQGRARIWLALAPPVGRRYLAFGEGFRPNETIWYTLEMGGEVAAGIVAADADGRFGLGALHLLDVPGDGPCRWAVLGSPGPLIVSFNAGPAARAVQ